MVTIFFRNLGFPLYFRWMLLNVQNNFIFIAYFQNGLSSLGWSQGKVYCCLASCILVLIEKCYLSAYLSVRLSYWLWDGLLSWSVSLQEIEWNINRWFSEMLRYQIPFFSIYEIYCQIGFHTRYHLNFRHQYLKHSLILYSNKS